MLNSLLTKTQKTSTAAIATTLRLADVEEHQKDRESLRAWERTIKDVIRHFSRFLSETTSQDVTAQLLKLEPTSEDGAVEGLGGSTAVVSALHLYVNTPNCVSGCVMLAVQLEFAKFLTRLTTHMTTEIPEESVQTEISDFHQVNNVLGYSLASAVAELCRTRSQFSPPVILMDTAKAIVEIARMEMSGRQDDSQFLIGTVGVAANKSHCEGTFALCCPASLLEESKAGGNAEPISRQMALCSPAPKSSLPRRFS